MSVSIEEAQARLPELIAQLEVGAELVITRNQVPIARLQIEPRVARKPRQPGSAKGLLTVIKDDDEHLSDFAEYLQ